MWKPRSPKWLVPLALLLVLGGVSFGLGIQRLSSEEKPQPGAVLERIEAPHLADLQKDAPFTLYAPTNLPAGFVEKAASLETQAQTETPPTTVVETLWYNHDTGGVIGLIYRSSKPPLEWVGDRQQSQIGDRTVWLERGETFGRPEVLGVHWMEDDSYVHVTVLLKGGMTEEDVYSIIESFAPVSSQAESNQ